MDEKSSLEKVLRGGTVAFSRLTVFLLRGSATAPSDFIRAEKGAAEISIRPASGIVGSFFFLPSFSAKPAWVTEVDTVLSVPAVDIRSASASGVMILQTSSRWFAISFGYGRSLIDPALIQRQFGLRVGLNLVDPSQLRSMDTKTFEDLVVSKSTQSSKSSDLPAFGVDVSRDILRGVAGVPRDKGFASRLAGSDAIVLTRSATASDLPSICDQLLSAYNSTDYKANFEWIDQLALVEEPKIEADLNDLLVNALQAGDTSATYMAAPENIDWEDVDSFTINGTRGKKYDDLDLDAYLSDHTPAALSALSLAVLRQRGVSVTYSRSQQTDRLWSVYQCLISEQQIAKDLYVLIEGRWFAVEKTLSDRVDKFFHALPVTTSLTAANPGESEPAYNLRIATTHPTEYLHLDAKIIRPGGASSGIEFCDLLKNDGTLIHVKRKSRSATLSHLFAQGTVSATSLMSDSEFRTKVREIISQKLQSAAAPWLALIPDANSSVDASNFKVSYVVLTKPLKSGATDWMPFFSKLNLMQHATRLKSMNFEVSVSRLDN
ncbi:DUF6119 family protein [Leucobacter chromiireducens]|uniref:DUF6119 family protein n=1 Tax=Leucobacter chromiireducens TaxID=283877 RepID=UPI0013DE145C|nr:DUF6119 family protein [Leucobacter chromiireducens]